jgi:hypothetical protein
MKCVALVPVVLLLGLGQTAYAEPAWGASCLSCHGQWQPELLFIFGHDTMADPDESATGAPDRGPLPVFQTYPGGTGTLRVEVTGLQVDDTYAVTLKRLRFPGVVSGGQLSYSGDCDWAEWGTAAYYYSDPAQGYRWGSGPTSFTFDLNVGTDAGKDYYDLVLSVAGRFGDTRDLFCGEQHLYLQVRTRPGDTNCDGLVNVFDIDPFVLALTNPSDYAEIYDNCDIMSADVDGNGVINVFDIDPFVQLLTGGG